jgi:Flp pilus assembly protein CpaB
MVSVVRHVVVGCVVVTVGTLLLPRNEDGPARRGRIATAPVVVAAADIQEGRIIDRDAVTVALWPVPTIPAGAYSSVDSVINRVARINVFKGEPLVPGRLAPAAQAPVSR